MIGIEEVLGSYNGLFEYGMELRRNLLKEIYSSTKETDLENSTLSKESLLRVKFIVSIHEEMLKNITEEYENFKNNPSFIQRAFFRNVDYLNLYEEIHFFGNQIFDYEGLKESLKDITRESSKGPLLSDFEKWIDGRLLIVDHELDTSEEEIATKLTKILEKRKEK